MLERQSDSRARARRNGIRSGLKENLSARREIGLDYPFTVSGISGA